MFWFHKFLYLFAMSQAFAQNVVSEKAHDSDSNDEIKPLNGRRQFITSHKVATKTYTTRLGTGNSGSSGLQGWVSRSQTANNILQPQIQSIVHSQQPCELKNNLLSNTGARASIVNKKSIVESSQTMNSGGSLNSYISNEDQYQSGQKAAGEDILVVEQLGDQSVNLQGSPSKVTNNNVKDLTRTIVTGNSEGINTVQPGIDIIENEYDVFYPDNVSHKVSIFSSGDGIYTNGVAGQQTQNLNLMVQPELNLPNIVSVPVIRPHFGQFVVHGYRPNIHYYLRQIEGSDILKNPSVISKVPSFIQHIEPDEMNVNLSEDQLNMYKQYLTQTGLIKLKPYQLIFSDQFRPNLRTLQWMVVPLESNEEYCRQRCGSLFAGNALYRTMTENPNKPLKLLVPILKIQNGLKTTVSEMKPVEELKDITEFWRTGKDSSKHSAGSNQSKI